MSQYDVAVIGVGTMGAGIARNLLQAGFKVVGFNRTAARLASLSEIGLAPARSPLLAAQQATFVLTAVSDDAALTEVTEGKQGLLAGLQRGSNFIDCGTTSPALSRQLASAAAEAGGHYLAAPMTGSKLGAESGSLTLMVAGPELAWHEAQPVFKAISKRAIYLGLDAGLAQAAKLCLNLSQAITLQGTLEAFGLAERLGVPLDKLLEVFEHSAARSGVQSFKLPYLMRHDYTPHFRLALMEKDLRMAEAEASSRALELPLTRAVVTVYEQARVAGLGEKDFLAVAELLRASLGVELKA